LNKIHRERLLAYIIQRTSLIFITNLSKIHFLLFCKEENKPIEETPDISPGKIIDTYIETDGGLN